MKYASTDYEIFTQALHQKIIDEEGFDGVTVQHDVTFDGKSGAKHQVDVCWRLEIARVQQLFCVECKYWKRKVKKEHIASFIAKLDDIGNARGIFVTTEGYQIGAIRLAKHNGITLINATYEIQERKATLEICIPSFHDFTVTFEEVSPEILIEIEQLSQRGISDKDIEIYNSEKICIGTLSDLVNSFSHDQDGHYESTIKDTYIHILEHPVRIKTIAYIYKKNVIGWPLHSSYEVASATVRYIFDDKEISAILNSHRNHPSVSIEAE